MERYTIALSGLSDTDAAMFEAGLDTLPEHAWRLVDGSQAYLLIVDIDTLWGHMDWLRATAAGQRVVAYTTNTKARGCDLRLIKPLRTRDLANMLQMLTSDQHANDASSGRQTRSRGKAKTAPPAAAPAIPVSTTSTTEPAGAAESSHATPEPAPAPVADNHEVDPPTGSEDTPEAEPANEPLPEMTLGECLLGDRLGQPCSVQGDDGVSLHLDPERGGYTGSKTLKPLQPLLDLPIEQARPIEGEKLEAMRKAPALPLTRLLWFAALSATPGELAPQLDPDGRYHLTRWPQIEREFPRHFRIATAMMKGPGALEEIAARANTPPGDVADFINAYSVAGYVSHEPPADPQETTRGGNDGMFSRLRRPFRRSGQTSA